MSNFFGENKPSHDHGQKSLRGGVLSLTARLVNALVQIGSVIVLARMLTPEDYGLVAMVMAVTGFAPLFVDLGTRDAVIQREHITEAEVSALFWMTMLVGTVTAVLVAGCGPLLSHLYSEPRVRPMAFVSGLSFITSALTCMHHALLRRAMRFRQLAVIEVSSTVVGTVVVLSMAHSGFGYWSLICRPVISNLALAAGLWLQTRWIPGRPSFTPAVKEMFKFGINLTGFSLTDFIGRTCDRIAIGRMHGAVTLGYYQKACLLYDNILDLTITLHSVAVVSLSKLRHDLDELRRLWSKGLSTLAFYAMPIYGVLAVVARDFVAVLLGAKWANAGILLSILAFRGIPHVVERTLGWLHVAAGRTDRWARWGVIAALIQVTALFIGLPYGTLGVATAYTVAMFLMFVPAIAYAGRPLGITVRQIISTVGRQLMGTLIAVALGLTLRDTVFADVPRVTRLFALSFIFLVTYLLVVSGFMKVRTPLTVVLRLGRDFLPKRFFPVPVAE